MYERECSFCKKITLGLTLDSPYYEPLICDWCNSVVRLRTVKIIKLIDLTLIYNPSNRGQIQIKVKEVALHPKKDSK